LLAGSTTALADEPAKATPSQPARKHFISENLPGLQTAEQSELLTSRALMQDARPFLTADYPRLSELESCATFDLNPETIESNFPMSAEQQVRYAKMIRAAFASARTSASQKAGAPATQCGIFAALSISPSPVPYLFLLDEGFIVFNIQEITRRQSMQPADLQAAAIWGVVVRRSISFGPTPPTDPIADHALQNYEELAQLAAGKLAIASTKRQ
jgi:hypothetical protein